MIKRTKGVKHQSFIKKPRMRAQLLGVILIAIGAIFLINPTPQNIKISFTAVLIGLFSIVLLTDNTATPTHRRSKKKSKRKKKKKAKKTQFFKNFKDIKLKISEKITVIIAIWILFLLVITGDANMETFFVSIFIGILVIKELTDEFTTKHQKYDLNIFIFAFLMVFVAIMGKKIISISGI